MKRRIISIVLIILFFIPMLYFAYESRRSIEDVENLRAYIREQRLILHGGGFLDEWSLTNSYEAMTAGYEKGSRIFEMDMICTDDGYVVMGHDIGEDWYALGVVIPRSEPLIRDDYLNHKWFDVLTTMDLDMVADFMREHEDMYVITDVKDDNIEACRRIKNTCPDLMDRFIIQIYHEDEYRPIHDMGFKHMIYTLYRVTDEERQPDRVKRTVSQEGIIGLTFNYDLMDDLRFFDNMMATGVPVYLHTINYWDMIEECLYLGVDAIYTDYTPADEEKYILEEY